MKKNKGFTLVELIAAMAIMIVCLNSFIFILSASSATIKQDKQKVKVVSFTEYFMQSMKAYGKGYFNNISTSPTLKAYFYFNTSSNLPNNDDLSNIINPNNFSTNILDSTHSIIKLGSYTNMTNKTNAKNNRYGVYFELTSSTDMGKDTNSSASSSEVILNSAFNYIKIYVTVVDLKSNTNNSSNLTFYIGR